MFSNQSVGAGANQPVGGGAPAPHKCIVMFGVFLSIPGTIMTCLPATIFIPGSILLGVGSLMMIIGTILAFKYDWKRNFPGYNINNFNERVRYDCKLLSFVWVLIGSAFASTGFVRYSRHPLAIAGCSIIGLAIVVILIGLILTHYLEFEDLTSGTSQPPNTTTTIDTNGSTLPHVSVDIETYPEPIPTISANTSRPPSDTASSVTSEESSTSNTQLFSDFQVLGTFLFIPGVCFSCVGWIRYYDRIVAGTLGAILLSIGGMLILISTFKVVSKASDISEKRSAVSKIAIMLFVSGVPLTAVGFTHLQPGLVLGIAGACLLGLSFISFRALRCCYKQEQTERRTAVTVSNDQNRNESRYPGASNDPAALGPHLGEYPTFTVSEIPNSAYPGTYSYPTTGSQIYPDPGATGINLAYQLTNYGPSTTAQSAANDFPSYNYSKNIPMPIFQTSGIPSAPPKSCSNTDQVDDANISPFEHVNEEDLPPPPSYDEVVKSGSNDRIA